METVLVSLITIGLIIVGTLTMLTNSLHVATTLSDSWKEIEAKASSIRRTHIVAAPPSSYTGGNIVLTVKNDGATDLGDFSSWDVIANYQTGGVNIESSDAEDPLFGGYQVDRFFSALRVGVGADDAFWFVQKKI